MRTAVLSSSKELDVMVLNSGPLKGINPHIMFISLLITVGLVGFALLYPGQSAFLVDAVRTVITVSANAWYVILAGLFLIFCVGIAFSKYGNIKLGDDHEKPEFGYFAWFAMVYAAGQGIGIIFWSIAEPMFHFSGGSPFSAAVGNQEAAESAMAIAFFHWGLNAWAIYCVVGLSLAFICYRLKKPLSIRYTLYPLFGDKVTGRWGILIDVIAVFATLFGIATSLGMGAQQINAGLAEIWGIPQSENVQLVLISVITVCALISVLTGLKRGVKYLSIGNMWLTVLLLVFFFAFGPTLYILKTLFGVTFDYVAQLVSFNIYIEPAPTDADASWKSMWQGWWTVFYWGWWMSWAPFVGVFVARVSRGRTIREFVLGVVGVSSLLSFVWLAAYGGTALYQDLFNNAGIAAVVSNDVAKALYATFQSMDLGYLSTLAMIVGTILVATYFITSSDSGTLVLTTIMSEGNEHPLNRHRVVWGIMQGVVAAVLLVVGGDAALSSLQTASIAAALPFSLIMLLMCCSLYMGVKSEYRRMIENKAYNTVIVDSKEVN
ncbi:BCCT family transporter [Oceanimonas pelagia]|uniref:BCCT family transporter n=1 Tax=Oceanimonas pelagia TaxID=3028314 RepID=A0AA50QB12_9GAMM|nr:BCCT family transporter [Oceanimonas pelagia]WMC11588.1 BCCT family transporter [Oceanimonas pelagia]